MRFITTRIALAAMLALGPSMSYATLWVAGYDKEYPRDTYGRGAC